jgi:hypothetical protein
MDSPNWTVTSSRRSSGLRPRLEAPARKTVAGRRDESRSDG